MYFKIILKSNDIEKYLLEDEVEDESDEEVEQLENQSTFQNNQSQINTISDSKSPITLVKTIDLPDSNISYYNNYELAHTSQDVPTINYRNTNQIYQPIHHRHFNNNYGK